MLQTHKIALLLLNTNHNSSLVSTIVWSVQATHSTLRLISHTFISKLQTFHGQLSLEYINITGTPEEQLHSHPLTGDLEHLIACTNYVSIINRGLKLK